MANLLGQVGAGAVMGGAAANMKTLREEAEELRKNSYLKLMQQYQQDNMKFSNDLATDRDATNRINAQEDAAKQRTLLNQDKETQRKWDKEDKEWEYGKRRGLIDYEARQKKASAVIGYDKNGKPITYGEADKYETIYGSPVGRESSKPMSVEQAKWQWIQEHGTEEDKRKAAGGNVTSTSEGMTKEKALKETAAIDLQIANLNKGVAMSQEELDNFLTKFPAFAGVVEVGKDLKPEDKAKVINALQTYQNYISRWLPNQGSGIIKDEVGDTIDSLLQR